MKKAPQAFLWICTLLVHSLSDNPVYRASSPRAYRQQVVQHGGRAAVLHLVGQRLEIAAVADPVGRDVEDAIAPLIDAGRNDPILIGRHADVQHIRHVDGGLVIAFDVDDRVRNESFEDLSDFNVEDYPASEALAQQKRHSLDSLSVRILIA